MKKDILATIKTDMKDVRGSKKYLAADLKAALKELEADRRAALAPFDAYPEDDETRMREYRRVNALYKELKQTKTEELFDMWQNSQTYYLIYSDGSEAHITAGEILAGEKFPKLSNIAYAEMITADDHMDTEIGNIPDWQTDDDREAYETAIQIKYNTAWGKKRAASHPVFNVQLIIDITALKAEFPEELPPAELPKTNDLTGCASIEASAIIYTYRKVHSFTAPQALAKLKTAAAFYASAAYLTGPDPDPEPLPF